MYRSNLGVKYFTSKLEVCFMEYEFAKDVETYLVLTEQSIKNNSKELQVTRQTIYNWMDNKTNVNEKTIQKFYEAVYCSGIHLNKIKEQLYREDCTVSEDILLFHGSKSGIEGPISLERARSNNDFGKGFYCGETLDQAAQFVSGFDTSSVYMIRFDPTNLRELRFCVDQDWMLTIAWFRGRLKKFSKSEKIKTLIHKTQTADYIIAPIADNRMFQIIDQFIEGEITDVQCQHCLSATNLGFQYILKTEVALKQTQILEKCFLAPSEKKDYIALRTESEHIGLDKVKLAKRKYRNQGKYIEEILE